jgi:hypothetical protein
MTVKELIEKLKEMPENAEVLIPFISGYAPLEQINEADGFVYLEEEF